MYSITMGILHFVGLTTNVKLLLKIIQDHNSAFPKEDGGRKMQRRVAGMLTILDDVKHRIQKSQSSDKKREAQLNSVDASLILSLLVCPRTRSHQNQYWMRISYKMSLAIAQLLEKALRRCFQVWGRKSRLC
ncbi:hypothetical protein IFM89_007556 [Coptis chinensis]|uniref:Uncharacterized protein n=1 Tax=Coptis chinensis TaxID=261450 RepID=A0A835LUP6_9MAGN|nr:hypothetical protein IFM89_007556 [Coptis chinensis]